MSWIPSSSFIPSSRGVAKQQFEDIREFFDLLEDRELFYALAHVAGCLKPLCRKLHHRFEGLYHAHPDIPVALMRQLAYWRRLAEGPYEPPASATK